MAKKEYNDKIQWGCQLTRELVDYIREVCAEDGLKKYEYVTGLIVKDMALRNKRKQKAS